jgi:hypothetical protein
VCKPRPDGRVVVSATTSPHAWDRRGIGFSSIAQSSSRQGDEHQRHGPPTDQEVQVAAHHGRSRKDPDKGRAVEGVPRGVRQHGQKHAAPRAVEDPLDDVGERDEGESEPNEVHDGASGGYVGEVLGGD